MQTETVHVCSHSNVLCYSVLVGVQRIICKIPSFAELISYHWVYVSMLSQGKSDIAVDDVDLG